MRVIFAGTPAFAVPCLDRLLHSPVEVVAVYSQPDRPAGRGRQLAVSAVKARALEHAIEVYQPQTLKDPQAQAELRALNTDLMVVVAYGLLLPPAVLEAPTHGCWNIHASLLPRWRGAAPIQRALLAGDAQTGVCLMQMERGLDTGPVILQRQCAIESDDDAQVLHDRLSAMGAELLGLGVNALLTGTLPAAMTQTEEGVSYARKIERDEASIDWCRTAVELDRQIRGLHGWPVAEASVGGETIKIHCATVVAGSGEPGSILKAHRDTLVIACGEGALRLVQVQRAGGRVQSAADFLNARQDLRR